jgi:hypothetical protein
VQVNTTEALIEARTGAYEDQRELPDVPLQSAEKKRLNWSGMTCKSDIPSGIFSLLKDADLAPLTTGLYHSNEQKQETLTLRWCCYCSKSEIWLVHSVSRIESKENSRLC